MPRAASHAAAAIACVLASLLVSDAAITSGVVVDWFNTLISEVVRPTPGMSHQQAALYAAGLALSMRNAVRCNQQQPCTPLDDSYAIAVAAHCYLNLINPTAYIAHDLILEGQLLNLTDAQRTKARQCGEEAATTICRSRVTDGLARFAQFPLPAPQEGVYRFTPGVLALTFPGLGDVQAYELNQTECANITNGYVSLLQGTDATGTPIGTAYYGSQQYINDLTQVKLLGAQGSTERNPDQTLVASFWNDGAGTGTAVGHYLNVSLQVMPSTLTVAQQVKFLSVLLTAISDASIPCFKVKYTALLWRPWTAINQTTGDPTWTPLLPVPGHPSYPSGHSCISGAASKALELLTGSDNTYVVLSSEGVPPGTAPRVYTRFSDIAVEAGLSRVYGGLHYPNDCAQGMRLGQDVAQLVWNKFARYG